MQHPNPTELALLKSRQIWSANANPDVLLSLGTGTVQDPRPRSAPHFRHILNDGAIPRLFQSFMSSFEGESASRDLENRLEESSKPDYFRFNVSLKGPAPAPAIDNIDCMDELRNTVLMEPGVSQKAREAASALLISRFFFELDTAPTELRSGAFHCQGSIRCRGNSPSVVSSLSRLHPQQMDFVTDNETLGRFDGSEDICQSCHRYRKNVVFHVRHPTDSISIYLRIDRQLRRKISGFPQTMKWFAKEQKLDCVFGTPEHGCASKSPCRACQPIQNVPGLTTKKRKPVSTARDDDKRRKDRMKKSHHSNPEFDSGSGAQSGPA